MEIKNIKLENKIEKAIEELVNSGYEYMRFFSDGTYGLYMDQNGTEMKEHRGDVETILHISRGEVVDYYEEYKKSGMKWDEVSYYFVQDLSEDLTEKINEITGVN